MRKAWKFLWGKKWLIVILLLVAAGGFWWWRQQQAQKEVIQTVKPQVRDIREELNVAGVIDAEEKAILKFPAPSLLTWVGVKEGEMVKKWQGIAKVDSRELQKQMQIALNTQGKVFRTFEETFDDLNYYDQSGLTASERRTAESAQLDLRNSVLNVELADLAVKLSYMYSPIDGMVVKIDQPNPGATISLTDTFQIVNPNSIYFNATVDEEDIGKITENLPARVELDAYEDTPLGATIVSIAFTPTQSESGGTGYQIKLSLPVDNQALQYKLGMNGDANILLNEARNALTIPVDALIERDGKTQVEILRNGNKEMVEITTGIADDEYVQVFSGITEQDDIVVPTEVKK